MSRNYSAKETNAIHSYVEKSGYDDHISRIKDYLLCIGCGSGILAEIIIDSGRLDCQLCVSCCEICDKAKDCREVGEEPEEECDEEDAHDYKWNDLDDIVIWNGWRMCDCCARKLKKHDEEEIKPFKRWMEEWDYTAEDFAGDKLIE